MKLYWRFKKNGKWTWKSVGLIRELYTSDWLEDGEITVILEGKLPEEE